MNKKGGLLINVVILLAVFIAGFVLGLNFNFPWSDSNDVKNEELNSEIVALQTRLAELEGKLGETSETENVYLCQSDEDCVLKSRPYCCVENLEYTPDCFHINELPPENLDCSGETNCPGLAVPESCICVDNQCEGSGF